MGPCTIFPVHISMSTYVVIMLVWVTMLLRFRACRSPVIHRRHALTVHTQFSCSCSVSGSFALLFSEPWMWAFCCSFSIGWASLHFDSLCVSVVFHLPWKEASFVRNMIHTFLPTLGPQVSPGLGASSLTEARPGSPLLYMCQGPHISWCMLLVGSSIPERSQRSRLSCLF